MRNPYYSQEYLSFGRWVSFWHQINEVLQTHPKTVLEVGKGSGIVDAVLQGYGVEVKTIDIDRKTEPDIVGDIRTYQFRQKFDTVLCAEVLEHLPFSDFGQSLERIHRVTRKSVVLTLPEAILTYLHLSLKAVPFVPEITRTIKIYDDDKFIKPDHRWEIGQKETPLDLVITNIRRYFEITYTYQIKESCHRFFVLK